MRLCYRTSMILDAVKALICVQHPATLAGTHSKGLFLVYTRRGANNDHIVCHRAPLFMVRVDTKNLHVIRNSEKVVVPERGAELGNFGACAITGSEGMFMKDSAQRGAEGATFVARILWSQPNQLVP